MRRIAGGLVYAGDAASPCPLCGGSMRVRKTFEHGGVTLAHGPFKVCETVFVCAAGCTRPDPDGQRARAVIERQAAVAQLLLPRSTVGYDVMTFVGRQRFVHYRQREEIRAELEHTYGITIASGEVSDLARRFLVYLEALHQARGTELRRALESDGGWPLHIDATGEDGQGTLLVAYAGWRGWALGAWKISTECTEAILPKLRTVEARFGAPCAIMRDLGKAVIEAARDFVAERKIPVLGCHLHFVKDIGKDLLRDDHDELRDLFRRFKVLPHLRTLARDLGRGLGANIERGRRDVADWLAGADERFLMPEGQAGLAVVRALGQWVLDYADDGTDAGFPFDRPYLDLYHRCLRVCRAAESLLRKPWDDRRVHRSLDRLHAIVALVRSELPFQRPARTLETRRRLFDELRETLRLKPKPSPIAPAAAAGAQKQGDEIRDVQKAVEAFQASLEKRRPERGPAQDMRKAIDLILTHLERHGPSLWGHVIALPPEAGGGIRLVERTNVLLESFFHEIKHGERRRSGRKILTQDFEGLPAAAVLARNLTKPDYVTILCGTLDKLPHAFAQLDAADRARSLPARLRATAFANGDEAEIVSSSLPNADRHLVRLDAMRERVLAEARTRSPRRPALQSGRRATVV
jgi:hypothetical protein